MSSFGRRIVVCMLIATISCGFLFRWFYRQSPGVMEQFSSYIVYPLLVAQHSIIEPFRNWHWSRTTMHQLHKSLAMVQAERDQLMAEVIELRSQLQYIDDFKLLAQSNKQFADKIVCNAQIVAKNFSEHQQYFFIDTGSSHGVAPDMAVIAHNCLLGKVAQVYPWYSKVIAITDSGCKIAACCYKTKTAGIHEGKNNIQLTQLNFVSHLDTIQENDYVFSSGEGLVFPRGLGIGQVASVKQEGLYQLVDIKPLADLNKIQFCSVLHKGSQVQAVQ